MSHLLTLNPDRREATVPRAGKEVPVDLTPKEMDLLIILALADGQFYTRQALLDRVWGIEKSVDYDTRTVDQHIARLRSKLGPVAGKAILTVTNYGYKAIGVKISMAKQVFAERETVKEVYRRGKPFHQVVFLVPFGSADFKNNKRWQLQKA